MAHRVLFVTETAPPDRGGMSVSCDRIVRGLRATGIAVDVLHFDRRAARPEIAQSRGGFDIRWPLGADVPHAVQCAWNRAARVIPAGATTHVAAFGGTLPLTAAPVFAAWLGRPLVTLLRGNEFDTGVFDPRRRPVLDAAITRAAAVCAVTTEHRDRVAALYGIDPVVVTNGIDLELWAATDADARWADAWRTDAGVGERRVLGLFGHLKAKKGGPFFLDALRRSGLASRFHLLVAGEADEEFQQSLGATEGLTSSLLPPLDRFDLIPRYLACDFVVLPSHYDGCPNVMIEAGTLGVPILGAAVGGMKDLLRDGETALLFAPGDEHECRRAIHRADAMSSSAHAAMKSRIAAVIRQRCDCSIETDAYVAVLDATAPARLPILQEA